MIVAAVTGVAVVVGVIAANHLLRNRGIEGQTLSINARSEDGLSERENVTLGESREQSPGGGTMRSPSPGKFSDQAAHQVEDQSFKERVEMLEREWTQSTSRLKYLESCLDSDGCEFSSDEPWTYDFDAHMAIALELREFTNTVRDYRELRGGELPQEAQGVARFFLLQGNDDVKEAALDLISLAPVSKPNLDATVVALNETASGELMRKGLTELRRYSGTEWSAKVDRFLIQKVSTGTTQVAREVARGALDFMNEKNLKQYQELLRKIPTRSQAHLYLRLNIEEAQRLHQGG